MILKIDHIALSSDDITRTMDVLTPLGYRQRFFETNVPNLSIKNAFLKTPCSRHDIALMEIEGGYPIEILSHQSVHPDRTDIRLIAGPDPIFKSLNLENSVPIIRRKYWNNHLRFDTVTRPCRWLDKSVSFWESMGFTVEEKYENRALLKYQSILTGSPLFMELRQSPSEASIFLDSAGFNSIAFITSSCKREKIGLTQKGYRTTEVASLGLDGKSLDICFVQGPSKELVELIQIRK